MPHLRYNGPFDAVDQVIDNETGETVTVERGHHIEVSRALADELKARGDQWSEVKDPGGAKAKAAAEKE